MTDIEQEVEPQKNKSDRKKGPVWNILKKKVLKKKAILDVNANIVLDFKLVENLQ